MSLPAGAVCLDAQGAQSPEHQDRGIARYVVEHARALHRIAPEALQAVLLNPTLPLTGNMGWLLGKGLLGWASGDGRISPQPSRRAPIYHVMSPFELQRSLDELWPQWARRSDVLTVATLYDVIPLVFPEHYLRSPVIRTRYEARAELVRRADHVLAISRTTADDAIEHLQIPSERVSVIDAGATERFASMYDSPQAARARLDAHLPDVESGYMLYVAGFEFRKNLERLISAYGLLTPELRAAHQLVIACRMLPSEAELLASWARDAGIEPGRLLVTGYVSDENLGALYHACELFLFASIYEGSGLPILEAMSCDAPVVASNTSTASEILGDLEGTFDPYDPASIADAITGAIESPTLLAALAERSSSRAAAYTWERVAEQSLRAYERALESHDTRLPARRRRPRLALVTPWPPERSGIADYNLRLARELGSEVDVDVVVGEPLERYAPPQEEGVRLVTAESFRISEGLHQPDRVLYCMGNSSFHRHVYELMRERPGALIAHDVRLTGFYGWFAGVERPEDPAGRLAERIEALYGPRLPASATQAPPTWERQAALGIYMTREIQQYVEQIFVHSRYALEALELDRGVLDRTVPLTVLPFGIPAADPMPQAADCEHASLIVSVGVVSEVKGLAQLIAAVALLAERRGRMRLVIAGPADEAELERWRQLARDAATSAEIELTGHVSAERYAQLLGEADLAVQLRTLSNGEASAAVADCLAAGLPTVVSDLGWAGELPRDVVSRVPVECGADELAKRLDELLNDRGARSELSAGALAFAHANSFQHVAQAYLRALGLA
ncbi:MAG TPA: glycosyltransferase [Solirubrobacteraceae bacterium]|jgi:glycosyltransferase involved in cell wall biosynthesis